MKQTLVSLVALCAALAIGFFGTALLQAVPASAAAGPDLGISDLALTLDSMDNIRVESLFRERYRY
jgi:hypothetical protein